MAYADVEVRIRKQDNGRYPVEITVDGEREYPRGYLDATTQPPSPTDAHYADATYGQALFSWLFAEQQLRENWAEIRGAYSQRRLRLRIDADEPALHQVVWEALCEPEKEKQPQLHLAASRATPFSRYLPGKTPHGEPVLRRPIKILVVAPAQVDFEEWYPKDRHPDMAVIEPDREFQALRGALEPLVKQDLVKLTLLPQPCTLAAIAKELLQSYHVLHLICHGAYRRDTHQSSLMLADDSNKVRLELDKRVTRMLAGQLAEASLQDENRLRLVFLASCETAKRSSADAYRGLAPQLVSAGVPAVVAMQDQVGEKTAREFATVFYAQLLDHGQVDLAANEARHIVLAARLPGPVIPVLFMRLRDGRLFVSAEARKRIPSMAAERQALDDYLARAVAAYEAEVANAVLQLPTRFDEPYKFLDAFALQDRHRFFGRDDAIQDLHGRVLQDRLTVVHAKSGAGKTSLLQAGLGPRLIAEGRLPLYARAHHDPVHAIKQAIARHVKEPRPPLLSELTLYEFLAMTCAHLGRRTLELVLILDQFEEFFIFSPHREHRQPFIDELADCYDDDSLPLRFVIALRKDYYSDLADFQARIPTIFLNEFRLDLMARGDAEAAITQPLTRLEQPLTYEPALLEALLDDLARAGMELPHLQILCTQLCWELPKGETRITLASYEALGRAEGILTGYLNTELARLPGGQGRLAREVLKELVSSEVTKRVLGYAVLAARIDAEAEELDRVLASLVNRRLLHRDEIEGQIRYEMAHEYLIEEIKEWIGREDLVLKQAQELLAREVASWRVHRTLIPRDRLELLYAQREGLRGLDEESWECILVSALEAGHAVEGWSRSAGHIGEKPLLTILDHPQEETHRAAMRGLGVIWELPAVAQLGYRNRDLRQRAAGALGELGDPRAVEPLIAALRDEYWPVRQGAAGALGKLDDSRAVEPLIATLEDEAGAVRQGAAGALGELGDPRAVEPLIAALGDEDSDVRWAAARVLGKLGEPAVEPLIAALGDEDSGVRQGAAGVLGALGESVVEPLIAALRDQDDRVREGAAVSLGKLGDRRAVEPLIAALRDQDDHVRQEAAGALGKLGEPAVEPLIAALRDEDWRVRQRAAMALGELGDPRAVEPLIAALQDNDDGVRLGAASALGKLGDRRAVEPLIAALRAKDRRVRRGVARALRRIGTPEAMAALEGWEP